MHLQKITLAFVAAAAASALACTSVRDVSAKDVPDRQPSRDTIPVRRDTIPVRRDTIPARRDTVPVSAGLHPTPPVLDSLIKGTLPARGLYVFRYAVNHKRLKHLIGIADSTEINAFVIDVKDEFGLNFRPSDPMLKKNAGSQAKLTNMGALVDTIRAHGILPVARIVVFKDSVAARMNPEHTIRKADGTVWHDKKGQTWVNPYANAIWEYNFRVAEEAIKMGFGEIQFDYIRFPEPYKSLPQQVFPEQAGSNKPQVLSEFRAAALERFAKLGVRTTADIFGLVATVGGTLEVGQRWEPISQSVDVVLPMVYPSHYPPGSFQLPHPNAAPYDVIHIAISRARERDQKLGIKSEHVRPWLQAFSIGNPKYGAHEIEEQKRGVYDAGYDGWVLWEPGSRYDKFLPALEKTYVTRKKVPPVPRPANRLD
jgi:hypothetical protein